MKWSDILQLKAWTPFSTVKDEARPIAQDLFCVGEHSFLLTQDVNRLFEENDPHAPFVTRAYWAASLEGLRRFHNGNAQIGNEPSKCIPPSELLFGPGSSYGDILKEGRSRRMDCSESAIYSTRGEFLYRVIACGRFEYCFLSNEDDAGELPFLIDVRLIK